MKNIILLLLCFTLVMTQAQEINQVIIDSDLEREILIGQVDEIGLSQSVFVEDWEDRVDIYAPDKVVAKQIKKYLKKHEEISIRVFFASWCGDSKEHIPDFVKLCQKAKIKDVQYYALSRMKSMPNMDEDKYQIEYVPTFIVYREGLEIGRIIETPEVSLEKDLWKLLAKEPK